MDFYHLPENIKKLLLDTILHTVKTASKKLGEYLGNKIADAVNQVSPATIKLRNKNLLKK